MSSTDLDGKYQISTTTSYSGPLDFKSDGVTVIEGGQTNRRDQHGCIWTSTFTILSDDEVEMVTVADPVNADPDFSLRRPDGTACRQPVTYRTVLKMARKDDRIQLSGRVEYGNEVTFITMRRVPAS